MLYFVKSVPYTPLNKFVMAALFFSFLGDTLLMLVPRSELFFLAGLLSFMLTHAFYILINMNAILSEDRSIKPEWSDLIFVFIGFIIFVLVKDNLGNMYIPVLIYTVVICMMAVTAKKRRKKCDNGSYRLVLIGTLFFLLSDAILAVDKFNQSFASADFLIMMTYITAQLLIVQGLIVFIQKIQSDAKA